MPTCTTLNKVPAYRIHKLNAQAVLSDAQEDRERATRCLIALAAMTPSPEMVLDEIIARVEELVTEIEEATRNAFFAQYIIDFPEDVVDEVEELDKMTDKVMQEETDNMLGE